MGGYQAGVGSRARRKDALEEAWPLRLADLQKLHRRQRCCHQASRRHTAWVVGCSPNPRRVEGEPVEEDEAPSVMMHRWSIRNRRRMHGKQEKVETLVHSFSVATQHIMHMHRFGSQTSLPHGTPWASTYTYGHVPGRLRHETLAEDKRAHSTLSAQRSACSFLQLFHEPHVQLSMRIPYRVLNEPLDERRAPDRRDLL
jgi:hypothetical protein